MSKVYNSNIYYAEIKFANATLYSLRKTYQALTTCTLTFTSFEIVNTEPMFPIAKKNWINETMKMNLENL